MPNFSEIDLGRSVLSIAIILGFFLVFLTLIRSIEIPIRIYLDKRKSNLEESNSNDQLTKEQKNKGFD